MIIKDMFNCTPSQKAMSSLEKWYCSLLEKDDNDLSLNDICIILRQMYRMQQAFPLRS